MLPTQIQINAPPSSPRAQQQVMPSNHLQGNSINSMPNFLQIHPHLGSTNDPRIIANSSIFTPLPPFMHAPNHPFPFQTSVPQMNPIGPVTHPGQFPFEFYLQNLNSVATNSNSFGVSSVNWGPNINQIHSFRNGQNVCRRPMPMNQSIPVQTPNYTHFATGNWSMAPQNAGLIPAQQFDPAPVYPLAQQAQNFRPLFIDPPQPKQVKNRQKWNSAGSGAGVDKQKNKTKSNNRKRRKKQKQEKESKTPTAGVDAAELEKKHIDSSKDEEKLIFLENESAQTKDNLVLRQLLRAPRYFDSSESWVVGEEVCQKCGNEDHKTDHCNVYKRKKPCFICGHFDHSGKLWKKAKGGFNCNISHLVKDCLEKDPKANENYRICLKCGDSGHSMFSCNNDYSPDDLKQMKCYICNDIGHLCCAEYKDEGPKQSSCYKCGELGHLGHKGCPKREGRSGGSEAANNLCDSCGEKGHIAVDCQKNAKTSACRKMSV